MFPNVRAEPWVSPSGVLVEPWWSPLDRKRKRVLLNSRYLGHTYMKPNRPVYLVSSCACFLRKLPVKPEMLGLRRAGHPVEIQHGGGGIGFCKLHPQPHLVAAPASPVNLDAHKSTGAKLKMKACGRNPNKQQEKGLNHSVL